jgi:hypothetical protein
MPLLVSGVHERHPDLRSDAMPYSGAKGFGLGRDGPWYAIDEITELWLMVINMAEWSKVR